MPELSEGGGKRLVWATQRELVSNKTINKTKLDVVLRKEDQEFKD